jgi:hypothetical protein
MPSDTPSPGRPFPATVSAQAVRQGIQLIVAPACTTTWELVVGVARLIGGNRGAARDVADRKGHGCDNERDLHACIMFATSMSGPHKHWAAVPAAPHRRQAEPIGCRDDTRAGRPRQEPGRDEVPQVRSKALPAEPSRRRDIVQATSAHVLGRETARSCGRSQIGAHQQLAGRLPFGASAACDQRRLRLR